MGRGEEPEAGWRYWEASPRRGPRPATSQPAPLGSIERLCSPVRPCLTARRPAETCEACQLALAMAPKACQHAARDSDAMWLLRPPVDMPLHDVPSELPMDEELRARLLMEGTTGGLAMQGVRPLGVRPAGLPRWQGGAAPRTRNEGRPVRSEQAAGVCGRLLSSKQQASHLCEVCQPMCEEPGRCSRTSPRVIPRENLHAPRGLKDRGCFGLHGGRARSCSFYCGAL